MNVRMQKFGLYYGGPGLITLAGCLAVITLSSPYFLVNIVALWLRWNPEIVLWSGMILSVGAMFVSLFGGIGFLRAGLRWHDAQKT